MADEDLLRKIQGLDDLDLAALLCLVSREHCIISTEPEALDDLVDELQLVAAQTFDLKPAVVNCHPQTTLDDFAAAILLPHATTANSRSSSPLRTRDSYFQGPGALRGPPPPTSNNNTTNGGGGGNAGQPQIANVILARDLDKAPKAVQIQALELLRTRRIFTRTSVQTAPKQFLLVAVLGSDGGGAAAARVTEHLNDFFYIAHWHDPDDGFARLDDEQARYGDDGSSVRSGQSGQSGQSVVRRRRGSATPRRSYASYGYEGETGPAGYYGDTATTTNNNNREGGGGAARDGDVFTEGDIAALAMASRQAHVDIEVLRYQMNIVSFLRMHRAVAGGIAPVATKHYDQLVRCLATLHGLDYVTPSLVALAAKKIYTHRIRLVAPDKERSMQWGSDLAAVEQLLDGVGPEDVIEDVLAMVAAPL